MRITVNHCFGQLALLLCFIVCSFVLFSCKANGGIFTNRVNREEGTVIPPLSSPLSKSYIGFGVITDSFTHVSADPSDDSPSVGYLRRGSLVRIVKRQTIRTQEGFISWVYTDGGSQGWLREDVLDIYDNESQARTASETMLK